MQIIIESSVENGKIPEWGLLEFQGSFLTRDNQPIYEEFMGDLSYTKDGIPFFIVGHHILFGEEVKLAKPFAVLNKVTDEDTDKKKYLVKAVVRRKIIFKTRPKPIICQQEYFGRIRYKRAIEKRIFIRIAIFKRSKKLRNRIYSTLEGLKNMAMAFKLV